ncbi:hypothetical protein V8C26DRAFT_263490 [Trichoderma gracile]
MRQSCRSTIPAPTASSSANVERDSQAPRRRREVDSLPVHSVLGGPSHMLPASQAASQPGRSCIPFRSPVRCLALPCHAMRCHAMPMRCQERFSCSPRLDRVRLTSEELTCLDAMAKMDFASQALQPASFARESIHPSSTTTPHTQLRGCEHISTPLDNTFPEAISSFARGALSFLFFFFVFFFFFFFFSYFISVCLCFFEKSRGVKSELFGA